MPITKPKYAHCARHNRDIDISKFNTSKNPSHASGYLPYCKDCLKSIWESTRKKMKSVEGACYVMCAEIGVPFKHAVWQQVIMDCENRKITPSFALYYSKLNALGRTQWTGFHETDCVLNEVMEISVKETITKQDIKRLEMDWGVQVPEDYEKLVYTFEKYTRDIEEFENVTQESLYRKLCLAELEFTKLNDGRSEESYKDIQARYLELVKRLKLDNFEENKPKTFSEQSLFALITQVQEENVKDVYKTPKKFNDFNKYKNYMKDLVLRSLLNTLCGHKDFNIDFKDVERYNFEDGET